MGKLHEAVKNKMVKDVKKLLNVESPNDRDKFYQTPLHIASGLSACEEIVKLLLKKKADVNVQDRNGWTPLHCCASHNNLEICELLLRVEGIDVGVLNKDGTSPLHYLVRSNPPEDQQQLYRIILDLYVEKRGDINSQSKHGEAALHQACLRGNIAAVKFLLANNANINMLNKYGSLPLSLCPSLSLSLLSPSLFSLPLSLPLCLSLSLSLSPRSNAPTPLCFWCE